MSTPPQNKKLLLIDGNAIVHRAFHALPPLTSPDGTVINAVYGFFSMVFGVVNELKPEYIIVAFDISAPTYRQSLYAGYHEHRPALADGLSSQFSLIRDALKKMNISIFAMEGFEADDVIGTIAKQIAGGTDDRKLKGEDRSLKVEDRGSIHSHSSNFKNPSSILNHPSSNVEVIILTGDRDLLQLVNPQVKVLMPIVGVTKTALFDEKAVEEKYGVKASQFIDYKALIGDPSDGYPGVTGIGPKTAADLLQEFGTFEELYRRIAEVKPAIAEKLATDAEQAALAKKLATILTDVPLTCRIAECKLADINTKQVIAGFQDFGFNSLLRRFEPLIKEIEDKKNGEQIGLL